MRRRRLAALLPFAALADCAHLDDEIAADESAVRASVEGRVGVAPAARRGEPGDAAISDEARALLAGGLTEEEAVRVALLDHRGLSAALEELGVARADLARAARPPNPLFTANAKFFDGGAEVELGLAQSFLELLFMPLRRRIAGAERAGVEAAVTRAIVHHVFDVRRAFAVVVAAEEQVASLRREADAADSSRELMRRLHDAGNATDPELTAAEIEAAELRVELSSAEVASLEARERVNVVLGLWGDAVAWSASGPLPEPAAPDAQIDQVESRALAASLDLGLQRARIEAAAERAGVRDWQTLLSPGEVGAAAKRESGGDWGVGPAVSLALPLFDGGEPAVVKAEARLRQELAREAELAVEVRSAARLLRERARSLAESARFARTTSVPLHARLVRETVQNYNAMQIGAFAVLAARREELRAQREAAALARDARLAEIDLDELLAGSLDRDRLFKAATPTAERTMHAPRATGGH